MLRLTLPWKERDCRMANRGPTFFAKTLSRYFFEYLPSERGLSQETIQSYRDAMSLLLDFCEQERKIRRDKLEVSDFNRELIDAFFRWLEQEKGNSITTRNQRQNCAGRMFERYALQGRRNNKLHKPIFHSKNWRHTIYRHTCRRRPSKYRRPSGGLYRRPQSVGIQLQIMPNK